VNQELPFDPIPFIKGTFSQTFLGSLPNIKKGPRSHTKFVLLPDKDYLALEITTPKNWKKNGLTVILIHGLCGSHKSPCLVRLARKLEEKNVRAVRVNLRGCGSGKGRARRIYHAGQSDDIFEVLKAILAQTPDTEIILIGFSLGGNIILKLTAELSIANLNILKKTIAINPPVDLRSSVELLAHPKNRIYEKYFIRLLKQDIYYRYKKFPDLRKIELPKKLHFYEYDSLYTVPEYGFKNVYDYYKRASSKFLISAIESDCNILFSEDDPIIKIQDFQNFIMPKNVHLFRTKRGGHIGYLSLPGKSKTIYWIDNIILDWIFD
jgi:predicted alpha/beta-fold hydrolase